MHLTLRRVTLILSVALGLILMPYVAFSVAPAPSLRALALVPNIYDQPVDLGFRPNPNGYSFANYGGVTPADLTVSDLRRAFGDTAVCMAVVNGTCIERPVATLWRLNAIATMAFGHCDGMASTSLRFFTGQDTPSAFQSGASTVYQLEQSSARRNIAYYFIRQMTSPVGVYKWQIKQNTPTQILNLLRSRILARSDPATLFVRQAGQGGHAITPYKIVNQGSGVYRVMVYDNNHPGDDARYVEVNTLTNTWTYNLGTAGSPLVWQGNAATQSFGIVPISQYALQPVCPWCSGAQTQAAPAAATQAVPIGQVWSDTPGDLLITNGQGQRFGYVNGHLVQEIPDAYELASDGGLGPGASATLAVPIAGEQTITISGSNLAQAGQSGVAIFGPGYAVSADNLTLQASDKDKLTVSADGTQVSYQAATARTLELKLAYDGSGSSTQATLVGAEVGAGKALSATATPGTAQIKVTSSNTGGSTYDLVLTVATPTGERTFVHENVTLTSGSAHVLDYSQLLTGGTEVKLGIDQNNDGTVDQTVDLRSRDNAVFIPLMSR